MEPGTEVTETGTAIVRITDDLVADGLAELRWKLRELLQAGARVVVVDVSGIRQLSSTSVAALLSTHRVCRGRGGSVVIQQPNRRTLDLLRRTGLHHVFQIDRTSGREGRPDLRDTG